MPGADIDFPLAFQIGPLPLQPGQRYQWVLDIDGVTQQDWHLTFSTRTAPERAGDVHRRSLTGHRNLVRHVRPTAAPMREPLCLRGRMNSAALDDSGSCRALSPISGSAPT